MICDKCKKRFPKEKLHKDSKTPKERSLFEKIFKTGYYNLCDECLKERYSLARAFLIDAFSFVEKQKGYKNNEAHKNEEIDFEDHNYD